MQSIACPLVCYMRLCDTLITLCVDVSTRLINRVCKVSYTCVYLASGFVM